MTGPPDWSEIDAATRPDDFTTYLETLTEFEAIRAYKRRSHRLLRPATGDRILDVGCGCGADVRMLAKEGGEVEVVGVDNSERMIETARERCCDVPSASFAVDDACDLSFAEDSFDAARADRLFQHLDDPAGALAELRRVTRPAGRICVSDTDWETLIIDAPDGYTEEFLSMDHAGTQNTTMGRRLYRLAREGGLAEIEIDAWTSTGTDLALLQGGKMLDAWTEAMQSAGVVTSTEVQAWYEGLGEAQEEGVLFCSLTGFTVAGTVRDGG